MVSSASFSNLVLSPSTLSDHQSNFHFRVSMKLHLGMGFPASESCYNNLLAAI